MTSQQKQMEVMQALMDELDKNEFNYNFDKERMVLESGLTSDGTNVKIKVLFQGSGSVVYFLIPFPFNIKDERRAEAAVATCTINYKLLLGAFSYDFRDGELHFEYSELIENSVIAGEDLYTIFITCLRMALKYYDKFYMLSKGMIELNAFFEE
ncbi:MAG: hypothetical protein K0S76_188 [Herbinix sp.]|jgi:hypothetical protein|nr:hypothetical protein [Herbinix sp.]